MCTVTYLPLAQRGFIFTSNRDEAPHRSSPALRHEARGGQQLLFPHDPTAGGTWIAVSSADRLACILNGAFEPHRRNPPYRRSRGLMALDFFDFPAFGAFYDEYEFQGMESFTMLVFERGSLWELRWDERQQHLKRLDPALPHIWSSAPLYEPDVQRRREQWFAQWRAQRESFGREDVLSFHRSAGEGDPWNAVVMNRGNIVRTLSITSILKTERCIDLQFFDLLSGQAGQDKILLENEALESR
jgi:uncharacterized protein with NRDE domain